MLWDYLLFADETRIAHSDLREDGTVLVAVERPVDWGFDSAECLLPSCLWHNVKGFTPDEVSALDGIVRNNAPFIFELAERHMREAATA